MRILKAYFVLGRLGMSPLTISVPIFAGYCSSANLSFGRILLLGLLGLCAHFFGFGLNDIIDNPIDRTVAHRHQHPLITGEIRRRDAWLFVLAQPIIAIGIYKVVGSAGKYTLKHYLQSLEQSRKNSQTNSRNLACSLRRLFGNSWIFGNRSFKIKWAGCNIFCMRYVYIIVVEQRTKEGWTSPDLLRFWAKKA